MHFENQEEEWIAKQEGWTIRSGWPARYFNSRGQCPFADAIQLHRFIATRGQSSELHKRIYLGTPWNAADHALARERGFTISTSGDLIRVARDIPLTIGEAVKQDAEAGDLLAIKAIQTITMRRLGAK